MCAPDWFAAPFVSVSVMPLGSCAANRMRGGAINCRDGSPRSLGQWCGRPRGPIGSIPSTVAKQEPAGRRSPRSPLALHATGALSRDMLNDRFRGKHRQTTWWQCGGMPARRGRGIELLVDPNRRRIVSLLAKQAMRSGEIARAIDRSRPTTTYHLRLPQRAGLIVRTWSRVDYRGRTYFVNPAMLRPIAAWLTAVDLPGSPNWRPPPR